MPRTRLEMLQQAVKNYEADLVFYEKLFIHNSEVLHTTDPKLLEEAMAHSVHLLEVIDKLKGEELPRARRELDMFVEEKTKDRANEQGKEVH